MPDRSPGDIAAVLGAIVEASPLAIAATQGGGHLVRYANPAFCRLAGQAVDSLLGRPLAEVVSKLQEQGAVVLLDRIYETGAAEQAVDLGPARAGQDGTHRTYTGWPILGDDRRPIGLLVQVSDTTEQVLARDRAEDAATEIRDVNQRLLVAGLEAQERAELQMALNSALREVVEERDRAIARADAALRLRDDFLAIASHELRTPLTTVKGTAQLALRALERGALDEARVRRHLHSIREAADRLERLLSDLMDVSRMRSGGPIVRPRPMDLAALVGSVAQRYAGDLGEHHFLVTHLPDGPVLVDGDAGRLEQVLDNLLSNAIKYTPAGGEIVVRLSAGLRRVQDQRDGIALTATDTGIGLPSGEQERIFEPFGRATNAARHGVPGMGLGLHLSRQIVEAHGGRMWAESAGEGRGSTFGVWLPRAAMGSASEQGAAERDDH